MKRQKKTEVYSEKQGRTACLQYGSAWRSRLALLLSVLAMLMPQTGSAASPQPTEDPVMAEADFQTGIRRIRENVVSNIGEVSKSAENMSLEVLPEFRSAYVRLLFLLQLSQKDSRAIQVLSQKYWKQKQLLKFRIRCRRCMGKGARNCSYCHSTGVCRKCRGTGTVTRYQSYIDKKALGSIPYQAPCPPQCEFCHGQTDPCKGCRGLSGFLKVEAVKAAIPAAQKKLLEVLDSPDLYAKYAKVIKQRRTPVIDFFGNSHTIDWMMTPQQARDMGFVPSGYQKRVWHSGKCTLFFTPEDQLECCRFVYNPENADEAATALAKGLAANRTLFASLDPNCQELLLASEYLADAVSGYANISTIVRQDRVALVFFVCVIGTTPVYVVTLQVCNPKFYPADINTVKTIYPSILQVPNKYPQKEK